MPSLLRAIERFSLQSVCFLVLTLMHSAPNAADREKHCSTLEELVARVPSNFSNIVIAKDGKPSEHDVTLVLDGATKCAVIAQSKKRSYYCVWEFPHRDQGAYRQFKELDRVVSDCLGQQAEANRDQSVNHPDFYDSRMYEMAHATVTVSVKDKSALANTFVYVWVAPKNGY